MVLGRLGVSWGSLGVVLGRLGAVLGRSRGILRRSWGGLGASYAPKGGREVQKGLFRVVWATWGCLILFLNRSGATICYKLALANSNCAFRFQLLRFGTLLGSIFRTFRYFFDHFSRLCFISFLLINLEPVEISLNFVPNNILNNLL